MAAPFDDGVPSPVSVPTDESASCSAATTNSTNESARKLLEDCTLDVSETAVLELRRRNDGASNHRLAPADGRTTSSSNGVLAQCNGQASAADAAAHATPPTPSSQIADRRRTHHDYIFGKVIGEGSFSTVFLVKEIASGRRCALKVCDKRVLRQEKKTLYVKREKEALCRLNSKQSPFVIKLNATFQGTYKLYFDLEFATNGELTTYINRAGQFNEECTSFYAAEVLVALEHLHALGIIHRDIKPENILLDAFMHIKIADFGSVKLLGGSAEVKQEPSRKNSFVGTAQYVAPEILCDKPHSKSIDLWSFGCTIYQMAAGSPPFKGPNEYLIFQKVMKLDYSFPPDFNPTVKDLVQKLLVLDSFERLGSLDDDDDGYPSIRSHVLFKDIPWETLPLQTPPPLSSSTEDGNQVVQPSNLDIDDRELEGLEPGLNEKQFSRLLGLDLRDIYGDTESSKKQQHNSANICDCRNLSPSDVPKVLAALETWQQKQVNDFWHERVFKNVILRMGMVSKRKGLIPRPRMLILTSGPHLYYFDVQRDELKGEIPWTAELTPEGKNFRVFLVHTPGRTYHLEDHERQAGVWCDWIKTVHDIYFPPSS